ncbi:hypothetical protein PGT21_014792 [Puccinia graminis f. sp. tritici]|uniref:Uncharacterized protein n=1 Tax=Puccinia graminis f. sp. tritici TaxID=56615 RepID=A0A5B0Q360_PUCGR|nr:hypothetical protein PGT21_014792 [Puccinia graminis f. sp. tritici]KAA1124730.1 hypothetical protein PGTUg99_032922 [Puccinia graminis f. sp. tritici]
MTWLISMTLSLQSARGKFHEALSEIDASSCVGQSSGQHRPAPACGGPRCNKIGNIKLQISRGETCLACVVAYSSHFKAPLR